MWRRVVFLLLVIALICFGIWFVPRARGWLRLRVTPAQEQAVVEAIQDEMYDEGCEGYTGDERDREIDRLRVEVHVYISRELKAGQKSQDPQDAHGAVVYKYQPFGEVYREFRFTDDGLVILGGRPEWDFPPTRASRLTVYIDEDEIIEFKRKAHKVKYVMSFLPDPGTIAEASKRQKPRYGDEYVEHERDCSFSWK